MYTGAPFSGGVLAFSFVLLPVAYLVHAYTISLLPLDVDCFTETHISSLPSPRRSSTTFFPPHAVSFFSRPLVLSSPGLFESWSGLAKRSFAQLLLEGMGWWRVMGVESSGEGGLGGMGCADGDGEVWGSSGG